ncbi:MAG: S8 family serine peptidase [Candidatus Marinimicrobia bacterium]|nr:S8 family serine peptidase [Candidatus Neomarinimicrobiota bacterium]
MKYIITFMLLAAGLFGETFNDRLLIYIENDVQNFLVTEDKRSSNLQELNSVLNMIEADKIYPWLSVARPTDRDGDIYLNRYFVLEFEENRSDLYALRLELEAQSFIKTAEEMSMIKPTYVPNDPYWNQQYFLHLIEAAEAFDTWDIVNGEIPGEMENGVMTVAIIDQGVDWDHPDLRANIWNNLGEDADGDGVTIVQSGGSWIFDPGDVNGVDDDGDGYIDNFIGWDVSGNDNDPVNVNSQLDHGTMVAGAASGVTDNGTGIASVGFGVKIMAINASHDPGFVTDGYDGILAAAQMGANVINCSWGGGGGNQSVINVAHNTYGAIVVASAGNGNDNGQTDFDPHYPSGLNNVISVSATGNNDNFNCWATAGTTIDLCAPGESIRTTNVGGGYIYVDGTSFSAPITAGAVALLWSKFPDESQDWIIDRILTSTDSFPAMDASCNGTSLVGMLGSGRLNISKSLSSGIFPSLSVQDIIYYNDDDSDGLFNPGETVDIKAVVANGAGWADAESVVATLSTNDPRISIIDNVISFPSTIVAGSSSIPLFDKFQVVADPSASLGDILCEVTLTASSGSNTYQEVQSISLSLTLNQAGFPTESFSIKSSPLISDLDGNGVSEIYFGEENNRFHAYSSDGSIQNGFPFDVDDKIRSSPAFGDLDSDGDLEIIFGSFDGKLYVVSSNGSQKMAYTAGGNIVGAPALYDINGDGNLEIIFTTQDSDNGKVYVITHTGTDLSGFPLSLGEDMLVGAAVGDLDGDGNPEIVVATWENNIYAIQSNGAVMSGFPFVTTKRFYSPPSLADMDDNGDLEIIAGNDNGKLFVLNHDATVMASFDSGDDIRGGISIGDINNDGSFELLFVGYDDHVHVWNPTSDTELAGWPIDLGYNALSCPVMADLDNDGDLEIITAKKSGTIYVFHHDGSNFEHFPMSVSGNIESTPAIGDLDNDGDFELAIGTTNGLQVIDIKNESGNRISWNMHRGNAHRNGYYDRSQLSISNEGNKLIPQSFAVSSNYPNPFNPTTNVNISLPEQSKLMVSVYDISGRIVAKLVNRHFDAGKYTLAWNGLSNSGTQVPTGIYFLEVKTTKNRHIQKLAYIK